MPFWPLCCESESISSKKLCPGYPGWSVHMGKFSSRLPASLASQPGFSYEHIKIFTKEREVRRDLGNRASLVDCIHMKRPLVYAAQGFQWFLAQEGSLEKQVGSFLEGLEVWGHAPLGNFEILDSRRCIFLHFGAYFLCCFVVPRSQSIRKTRLITYGILILHIQIDSWKIHHISPWKEA